MPFTVDSPDLPSNVKSLDSDMKAQWVEVFNDVFARCQTDDGDDCEGVAMTQANGVIKKRQGEVMQEAVWTAAQINDFPDSSFAIIMPGGEKDEGGKTVPRSLRKLPYKNKEGTVDIPHLRNALSRLPQVKGVSDAQLSTARATLNRAAEKHLKTRQEESMKLSEALKVIGEASQAALGAIADLRQEIEGLELEEDRAGSVMAALELLEQVFTPKDDEEPPEDEEEPEMEETTEPVVEETAEAFAESMTSGAIVIAETDEPKSVRDPLAIKMRLIKAGPGNPHDKHYYPGKVLRRDAHVFEGVFIYTTPHNEATRSEENKVGKVREVVEFEPDGSPIADAILFDPAFAEKARNRVKSGELDSLEFSILAKGVAKEADIDGETFNVVESIESAQAVDAVPRAGAGGKAVSVAESAAPPPEPEQLELPEAEPTQSREKVLADAGVAQITAREPAPMVEKARVLSVLRETNLPKPSQERLADGEYQTDEALSEAITKETEYVKSISGSGQPLGGGATQPVTETKTAEQRQKEDAAWYEEARIKHGLSPR